MHTTHSHWRTLITGAIALCALGALFGGDGALSAQTASVDLLKRAANPNPTLNSYTASAQLSATLHVLVPVHKDYNGNVYYLRPNRKIEFQNVSGAFSKFKDLATTTPTYEQAVAKYTITPLTDNGTISKYTLVPKTQGRVKSVTVSVDDASALIKRAEWRYTDGGTLSFDQTYATVGNFHVPSKANVSARFPDYSVDGTLTFTNYQPNAPVSPSVFNSQ
jgi:hypothetical protein